MLSLWVVRTSDMSLEGFGYDEECWCEAEWVCTSAVHSKCKGLSASLISEDFESN